MENRRENDTAEVSYGVCPRRVFSRLAPHPDKYMVEFNITGLTQREKNATKATSRFFPPVNTGAMLSFPCSRGPFVEFVERREFRGEVRVQELLPVFLPKLRTFFFFFCNLYHSKLVEHILRVQELVSTFYPGFVSLHYFL